MSKLEKLVAEDTAIRKAEHRLRLRRMKLEKGLQDYRLDIVIVDDVIYQVTDCEQPAIMLIGNVP